MASAFSHAFAAYGIGKLLNSKKLSLKFWLVGAFCAVIPDADVIAFKFGIPYEHVFGHRGFSHSILFAFLLAIIVTFVLFRKETKQNARLKFFYSGYFFLATISHAVLDAVTTGGLGVAFFAPFDNSRHFFPFRPVKVSPIGAGAFFSEWGIRVIISEFIWIWLPFIMLIFIKFKVFVKLFKPEATAKLEEM